MRGLPCLLLVLLLPREAVADSARHVAAGKRAFAERRYVDAIAEFRAALAARRDPRLVYAIAQAQRLGGDCGSAITSYEELIAKSRDRELVSNSRVNIARCRALLAAGEPVSAPEPEQPLPLPAPPAPPPFVSSPPPPPPLPLPLPLPPPSVAPVAPLRVVEERSHDTLGYGLVATGVVATVIGSIAWYRNRRSAEVANAATDYGSFLEAHDAAASSLRWQHVGAGAGIAGLGLVIAGAVTVRF